MPSQIYSNEGNAPLLSLLVAEHGNLLDIGCGAGDNARILKSQRAAVCVTGITHSPDEAILAGRHMMRCLVFDIERGVPESLEGTQFDVLLFSHVLEHLRQPAAILRMYLHLLKPGGEVLIAVPNILSWRMRMQFLSGDFDYQVTGALDETHLRFFTYRTAQRHLLSESPNLDVVRYDVEGSVPLWWLRRKVLPGPWSTAIDRWGCKLWPNLFGTQVLLSARKR